LLVHAEIKSGHQVVCRQRVRDWQSRPESRAETELVYASSLARRRWRKKPTASLRSVLDGGAAGFRKSNVGKFYHAIASLLFPGCFSLQNCPRGIQIDTAKGV
jgi:hypothetical protein